MYILSSNWTISCERGLARPNTPHGLLAPFPQYPQPHSAPSGILSYQALHALTSPLQLDGNSLMFNCWRIHWKVVVFVVVFFFFHSLPALDLPQILACGRVPCLLSYNGCYVVLMQIMAGRESLRRTLHICAFLCEIFQVKAFFVVCTGYFYLASVFARISYSQDVG